VEHDGFFDLVHNCWSSLAEPGNVNTAKVISSKFKKLREELKAWSKSLSNLSLLIKNCNKVIGFLDTLEDRRGLYNPEINLRILVKVQVQRLLHYKNMYWKQRYNANRIKFGDECTKFFHTMATNSFRKNTSTQILNDQGAWIQDHEGKAGLLWNSFKNRLGVTSGISMHFQLSNLITPRSNLLSLVEPWSHSKIDNIVKNMPNDKAPGPDGFNGLFLKRTWPIIKEDFYKLYDDFYEGIVDISGINRSYITLLAKITNPETVNDYRPLSLMNISPKLISKLVADRLQGEILSLIHKNQYGL